MRANRLIGRRVADRFTIKRFLGEGGMATVFVAEQDQEPREVALKIMNEDLNADRTFVKRFQREAKAAARVQHPNSVAFIDYGVADGLSYIAMELLTGDDLYILLERDGAITQGRAARLVVEVCDALMVAHELGIVHRDLKPENIMVISDPAHPSGERVKVLDFGIAKLLAPDTVAVDPRLDPASGVTRAGTFIGTPSYMSPEQCALLPVDTRADIYTCGVLLFQLVTGRLPFEGQTPLHTATLHIHEAAPRPSTFAPSIDPRLEAVIMKALSKKPTERQQTARHLAATLRKLLPDLPDVKVALVAKPKPGSLRPRTRNSVAAPPPAAGHDGGIRPQTPGRDRTPSEIQMDSAKTMVAPDHLGPPPPVVLRSEGGPPSDPSADSTPARIRPAAGGAASSLDGDATLSAPIPARDFARPPPAAAADDDDDDPDSDDSMRTLVRPPTEDDVPRTKPQHTEVIAPDEGPVTPLMAIPNGAPSPRLPSPALPSPALPTPRPAAGAHAVPVPKPPPRAPSRLANPTLKSAVEFQPTDGAPRTEGSSMGAPPPNPRAEGSAPQSSAEVSVGTVLSVGGPGALGSIKLGSAQLTTSTPGRENNARGSAPPAPPAVEPPPTSAAPPSQIVITPAGFASTTKMEAPDRAAILAGEFMATAQTVPLISPSLVASAVASGPRPAAGAPPSAVFAPPQPPGPTVGPMSAPGPTQGPMSAQPSGPAPLPPTPPIFPLAPAPAASISGTRGLLIGFLAGAVLMALAAAAWFLVDH